MTSTIKKAILAASIALISFQAQADYIVDTGAPTSKELWELSYVQQFAVTFDITSSQTITSIEGYFGPNQSTFKSYLSFSLFAGDVPSHSAWTALNRATIEMPTTPGWYGGDGPTYTGWYGAYGLNWSIGPGTYTLVLDPIAYQGSLGYQGAMVQNASSPLDREWSYRPNDAVGWVASDLNLGIRIANSVVTIPTVPEPENLAMLLAGLGLLGIVIHRKKQA